MFRGPRRLRWSLRELACRLLCRGYRRERLKEIPRGIPGEGHKVLRIPRGYWQIELLTTCLGSQIHYGRWFGSAQFSRDFSERVEVHVFFLGLWRGSLVQGGMFVGDPRR